LEIGIDGTMRMDKPVLRREPFGIAQGFVVSAQPNGPEPVEGLSPAGRSRANPSRGDATTDAPTRAERCQGAVRAEAVYQAAPSHQGRPAEWEWNLYLLYLATPSDVPSDKRPFNFTHTSCTLMLWLSGVASA
jgi:hypothetical protein